MSHTRYTSTLPPDGLDLWVHVNCHWALVSDPGISIIAPLLCPFLERCAHQRENDIDNIRPRKFEPLLIRDWKCLHCFALFMLLRPLQNLMHIEPFILWQSQYLDRGLLDHAPPLSEEVPQMVDGYRKMNWWPTLSITYSLSGMGVGRCCILTRRTGRFPSCSRLWQRILKHWFVSGCFDC